MSICDYFGNGKQCAPFSFVCCFLCFLGDVVHVVSLVCSQTVLNLSILSCVLLLPCIPQTFRPCWLLTLLFISFLSLIFFQLSSDIQFAFSSSLLKIQNIALVFDTAGLNSCHIPSVSSISASTLNLFLRSIWIACAILRVSSTYCLVFTTNRSCNIYFV